MWKYLKVVFTAVSLLLCALLIAFWVRSYTYSDYVTSGKVTSRPIHILSQLGVINVALGDDPTRLQPQWETYESDGSSSLSLNAAFHRIVRVPYWSLIVITATIAALPWIKWRFSLRTLLIVMTLFAVFFGMIAMSL